MERVIKTTGRSFFHSIWRGKSSTPKYGFTTRICQLVSRFSTRFPSKFGVCPLRPPRMLVFLDPLRQWPARFANVGPRAAWAVELVDEAENLRPCRLLPRRKKEDCVPRSHHASKDMWEVMKIIVLSRSCDFFHTIMYYSWKVSEYKILIKDDFLLLCFCFSLFQLVLLCFLFDKSTRNLWN